MSTMPRRKLPQTLYKLCLEEAELLIANSCQNIHDRYGNYDDEFCRIAAQELQSYLLLNIPGILLDDICDRRRFSAHSTQNYDPRISLSIYIHKNMRKFFISETSDEKKIGSGDSFWVTQLSKLQNIVVLDMHLACTDEILEVVGRTCLKLEQINIVSRLEPDKGKINSYPFNALKLKFFVSDDGLHHLKNCKLLKYITMNKIIRSHVGGKMMTPAGIRGLVKSLPQLQSISYNYMGIVLGEEMDDIDYLPLTCISDYIADVKHTQAIARLCLNLHHLCLGVQSDIIAPEILNTLTNSSLQLVVLELDQFPFCDEMVQFLIEKGKALHSLRLRSGNILHPKHVRIIGETCPNLKSLSLRERDTWKYLGRVCEMPSSFTTCSQVLFSNLECLKIEGTDWIPKDIIPLLLINAKHIEKLSIFKRNHFDPIEPILFHVLKYNPLHHLKKFYLLLGCDIKMCTVVYLAKNCLSIRELAFSKYGTDGSAELKELNEDIKRLNLDLKVCPFKLE
ncbi:uncharacterized protein LOC124612897 [Schistocerca americana]|uniref:uncharacterized protein LOC124612897 n=1 Tax=Schistocerca americana TaxID=7009 RepID=UPI001F4F1CA7|nr:uncharacterized protein LOC124612897 [Schistocerca americana]XP_046997316.1 uncharacterized protein LOC124612897 [Schistocerca americana]XP_046997317.1 uncharacterized protein LOC124612897 [Schistocerca americana]